MKQEMQQQSDKAVAVQQAQVQRLRGNQLKWQRRMERAVEGAAEQASKAAANVEKAEKLLPELLQSRHADVKEEGKEVVGWGEGGRGFGEGGGCIAGRVRHIVL